jgi:hypothetical protein
VNSWDQTATIDGSSVDIDGEYQFDLVETEDTFEVNEWVLQKNSNTLTWTSVDGDVVYFMRPEVISSTF